MLLITEEYRLKNSSSVQRHSTIWGLFLICIGAPGFYLVSKLHIISTMKLYLNLFNQSYGQTIKKYFMADIENICIYMYMACP